MGDFGDVNNTQTLTRQVLLNHWDMVQLNAEPVFGSSGTTPSIPGYFFTETAGILQIMIPLPDDMDRTIDPTLRLFFVLTATETNGDTLDLTYDYVAMVASSTGDGSAKTSTNDTASQAVTTGNGLAIGDLYAIDLVIDAGDATNPLAGADVLVIEFHMTNTTGVAEMDIGSGTFTYEASY